MSDGSRAERKRRLAEAVWGIVLTRGITAVSVRTVAKEAGMSVGSLRHLFSTQAELLEFSAELMVERATLRVRSVPPGGGPVDHALDTIREVLPLAPESRREFEVNIALIAATPAHPGLARIRDEAHDKLIGLFARIVAELRGEPTPTAEDDREARRLLALVDGIGLHLLHQSATSDTEWAVDLVRAELDRIQASARLA